MLNPFSKSTVAIFLAAIPIAAAAQNIVPEPIKLPVTEFPVPTTQFDQLVASNDVAAMRAHAWSLWSGITADSSQIFENQRLPIWETWISEDEIFAPPTVAMSKRGTTRRFRSFTIPQQFAREGRQILFARAKAVSQKIRVLASVKFSPDSESFIKAPHTTPANASDPPYQYTLRPDLQRLNAHFDAQKSTIGERKIIDFPAPAIDLKIVYQPVKATGLTPLPIWNGEAGSTIPTQPSPDTWKNCVAVDPTNKMSGTAKLACNGSNITADIVPLSAFYSFRLTAEEAQRVNQLLGLSGGTAVQANDFVIVVAMHITTKEIANWTWQTFWWQNGKNPPNNMPGSIEGMPDATKVKGPWRNFAMCIGNSMVIPYNDPKGAPVVCYNPWLETSQADGIHSNCMTCHMRATFQNIGYPDTYLPNGWLTPSDAQFAGASKTDFVWAIPDNAH